MAKDVAPPKSTGGGGFVFEDKVCAWFLAHMLSDEPPFGVDLGLLDRADFQTRPDGWFLDDLLLILAARDGRHRCALSVKSNVQFGVSTAPPEFVRTAWEQFLHDGSTCFDETTDYLGLVTAPLPTDTRAALAFVVQTAKEGDPKLLPARYAQDGWASKTGRSLFESFSCPADLAQSHGVTSQDTGRLIARLQFFAFDFELSPSEDEKRTVERCRRALRSGEVGEAAQLWKCLLQMSADRRPQAGCITRQSLLEELRHQFRLADRPDHRSDWAHLKELTTTSTAYVHDSIGGRVHLPRDQEIKRLRDAVEATYAVVLLGPSGAGKSAIAKRFANELLAHGDKYLWFEAQSFERVDFAAFEADLRLTHGLSELLTFIPDASALLVLDGLDRLYDERAFALVASLLSAVQFHQQGSPWHLVLTCQTQEWLRLQESLLRAGIDATAWYVVECELPSVEELRLVWDSIPRAARLQHRRNLHPLLVNLKVLDLIAARLIAGREVPTSSWVGESSVAAWFWESEILRSTDGLPRARLVTLLAERQADALRLGVPLHELDVSDLGPLDGLVRDHVCRRTADDQVVFEHDLFGDWARLRVLVSRSDSLVGFLRERLDLPLWHRAVRLYGVHLLEHVGDTEKWRDMLSILAGKGDGGAEDLLLESIIFAADPLPLLEHTRPDLLRDDGRALRRLLRRFLVFATLPDPRFTALVRAEGRDDTGVAVRHRYPNWPYWPPMLRFLYTHRAEVIPAAPVEVGQVVDLWLSHTPQGTPFRRESAQLGLILGERALQARNVYTGVDHKHGKLYYRVALAGACELPDAVAAFALRASERSQETEAAGPAPLDADLIPESIRFDPRFDPDELLPEPWPDGPRAMVDDDFREVVLDTGTLMPLVCVRPKTAREVALAVLIKPRRWFEWSDDWYERTQLDLDDRHHWHPPLYIHEPFLGFLRTNFDEGLDLIARLVNFATERWRFYAEIDAREYQAEREAQGDEAGPFGRMMRDWCQPPGGVLILVEGRGRELLGDSRVYGWSAGFGNPPSAVQAALMALAQYLYMELDASRSIEEKVCTVLEQARSAAFLKVLCDVGRREVTLFEGPLRPLLAVPEVYYWDITSLAKAFHELEHCSIDLRYLALRLFLGRPAMRSFFGEVRGRWEEQMASAPDGRFREFLADLVITFDIENYEIVEHPEHGHVIVNVRAQELEAERAVEGQAFEEQSLVVGLPIRCRQMIDTGTVLHGAELENFWRDTQRIATRVSTWAPGDSEENVPQQASTAGVPANEDEYHHPKSSGVLSRWFRALERMCDRIRGRVADARQQPALPQSSGKSEMALEESGSDNVANAIVGAVAVLVRLHGDWLAEYPERMQWCLDQLVSVVLNPPPRSKFDVPESAASWTWDCFAAEALPVLWARDPANAQLRHLVARLVFALHYVAVRILFGRCAEQRAVLGDDFGRLRRLLFEWANVRKRIAFVHRTQGVVAMLSAREVRRFDQNVTKWAGERIAAFVKGHTPSTCGTWHDMDDPTRFRAIDALRKRWHRTYYLDLRLVRTAHAWLPTPDQSLNTEERHEWLEFWREALQLVLTRAKESKKTSNHSYLYEDEEWILDGVAIAVQYMEPEERPEELWRLILDLPAEAHHWSENFLRALHRHGLTQDPAPPGFASIRRAMIEHVLTETLEEQARQRWSYYKDVWEALIGIDGFTRHYWVERHRELAELSLKLFERWIKCVGAHGRHLATFARWMELAAAEPVRLPGVVWLERALISDAAERVIDRKTAAESVASLLNIVWRQDEPRLRRDATAFAAFRSLLQWLVDQQNAIALNLIGRLGGLM